jgi:flavin reductase (DIM6/NTAB) family NADH-FMN oxidoreductase RutF
VTARISATPTGARTGPAHSDARPPDVDGTLFRQLMGSLVSGVSILTTRDVDGTPFGMTCSAVCSVSASPPLLLACIGTPSSTLNAIRASGRFALNFLDVESQEISGLFAGRTPDKFARVSWRPGPVTGMPVLAATVARIECATHQDVSAGDHEIVVGRIVGGEIEAEAAPLGYWRGSYHRSAPVTGRA